MTRPRFGALPEENGVRFRVAAAAAASAPGGLELVLLSGGSAGRYRMRPEAPAVFETVVAGAAPGDRYGYSVDGGPLRPDPASRFQPDGVHGPSEIVDPGVYHWRDRAWRGRPARELVVYELHVGTLTPEGTFDSARARLPLLRDLGVTTIEILPVADFAGSRNWGYDGVALYAPSRAYGRPDDLRALVDDAHAIGLGVMLDVVYNHLGPEGAYLLELNPVYRTGKHSTPWGDAINLDGCSAGAARGFIVDNAVHWVREYHLDGLRLDATHALVDESPVHITAEIARDVRSAAPWPVTLHAEDHRNLATIVEPAESGGWGMDGLWADDFHHSFRRLVAGDAHAYYRDFEGTAEELARIIRQGWLYTGQRSTHMNCNRGTDASRVPLLRCVVCLQNHDQVGNRAAGDRLHHQIDLSMWRAASVLLLTAPMTPLLFMGQEWAASTPFQYFTDLEPALGRAVTEGRRREFRDLPGFHAPRDVPDPQAVDTFLSSKLRWDERREQPHAPVLALYTRLLALRAAHPALQASERCAGEAWAAGDAAIVMRRADESGTFLIVASLRGGGTVEYGDYVPPGGGLEVILTTEEAPFAPDSRPPRLAPSSVSFERAGAVILRQSL